MSLRYRCVLLLCTVVLGATSFSQTYPKREFRAAWVASVTNLDWPSSPSLSTDAQKASLISLLDQLKAVGINVIIFQVRPECDALYASSLEPWSYWLTGRQGIPPAPYYDPLEFAVAEAHVRGMELHAWFNPYRAVRSAGSYTLAPNHVAVLHPDWLLSFSALRVLDPGLPAVRRFVTSVIMDVVRRYDVDGIHFDDYFYPYEGITTQDAATYAANNPGSLSLGDWRRDNVNQLVRAVHDSIQVIKPFVKFGISPFGIWKSGTPSGITGMSAYSDIYCDAVAWMQNLLLDYLTPQLYWPFGGGQDYGKLQPWWASQMNGRHLYPGHAAYRIANWTAAEMPNQILLDRTTPGVYGSVYFRALAGVLDNPRGFVDSLKNRYYRYPSLLPIMTWKDVIPPYMPRAIRHDLLASTGRPAIQWDLPLVAPDGDTATRYALYRFDHMPTLPGDLADAQALLEVTGRRSIAPLPKGPGPYYYVATALDRNFNESEPSNVLTLSAPAVPVLALPAQGATMPESVRVSWRNSPLASYYHLQIGTDSTFTGGLLLSDSTLVDTAKVIRDLAGQTSYYWRVRAFGAGGVSTYSSVRSFVTGTPLAAPLLAPPNLLINAPTALTFQWGRSALATSYRFQLSAYDNFSPVTVDTAGLTDTTLSVSGLANYRIYFWRVRSANALGASAWSGAFKFRTVQASGVAEEEGQPMDFALDQNYPNPFNPLTTIRFALPMASTVTLKVYDMLGREVDTLVDGQLSAGFHTVVWDGARRASGMYICRLVAGRFTASKRMLLIR